MTEKKCMVCEKPTLFAYRIGEVEASFCPEHLPRSKNNVKIIIRCSC